MKIKSKLKYGIGALFVLISLLSFFGVRQIISLASDAKNILKDNQKTIEYTRRMLQLLSEPINLDSVEYYLDLQKENITEIGEQEITQSLNTAFIIFKNEPADYVALRKVKDSLFEITDLNLKAIEKKNLVAAKTAKRSVFFIGVLGALFIFIALVLFFKLPTGISNTIKEFIDRINQIADDNYSQRVTLTTNNEFLSLAIAFNKMASRIEEFKKSNIAKLIAEKKRTETLINKINYPILGIDISNKINLINQEFLSVSGLTEEKTLGRDIYEISDQCQLISQIFRKGENVIEDRIHVEKDGKDLYFEKEIQEISFSISSTSEIQLFGYVVVLKNITKFMELDMAKTNFIATISHELKTPISAIKLSLQLLENEKTGQLNDEQQKLISSCEEDANQLLEITSELLNLAQAETGNIQLNMGKVSPKEIINYAINTIKPVAEQKDIEINQRIPSLVYDVIADKEKTAWVLVNLLSNAIRYSPRGSNVLVTIDNIESKVLISVIDYGRGIEDQYKDKIFNRYFQVPGIKKEGTGLGLAISKEFIETQGGELGVKSELGQGSTFEIKLNRAEK